MKLGGAVWLWAWTVALAACLVALLFVASGEGLAALAVLAAAGLFLLGVRLVVRRLEA